MEIDDEKLAKDDPERLVSRYELLRAYKANGQIDKAEELTERSSLNDEIKIALRQMPH